MTHLDYNVILEFKMNESEILAYKIAVLYEQEFLRHFSSDNSRGESYRLNTIPKNGDPRKSFLFKNCWKLRRETRGLLTEDQYRNYIKANLAVLRAYESHNISPSAICGEKAWIRWKVWERIYNQKLAEKSSIAPPPSVSTTDPKIIAEIDKTKKFLFEKCEGEPTKQKIQDFLNNGFFRIWTASNKVSIYYLMMSCYTKDQIKLLSSTCGFDPLLYKANITDEVQNYFNHEFTHESNS